MDLEHWGAVYSKRKFVKTVLSKESNKGGKAGAWKVLQEEFPNTCCCHLVWRF